MNVFRGTMHGKMIELERESGLPDGEQVTVVVQPNERKRLPPGEGIRRSEGGWADDTEGLDAFLDLEPATAQARSTGDRAVSFLLDTDTCSFHLKKKGALSSRFLQYLEQDKDQRLSPRAARTYMQLARNWSRLTAQHPRAFRRNAMG